jgi:hypothetical protein
MSVEACASKGVERGGEDGMLCAHNVVNLCISRDPCLSNTRVSYRYCANII